MPENKKEGRANKGSQKWIQDYINQNKKVKILNQEILTAIKLKNTDQITWVSPLKEENYKEYRDKKFLSKLGLGECNNELSKFWPEQGPQWDALGKTTDDNGDNVYILLEAKANTPEIFSQCAAKHEDSRKKIDEALQNTDEWFNFKAKLEIWRDFFYQYANRLAHLYFFREKLKEKAYMIFVYFMNDKTHIPTSEEQWEVTLKLQKKLMKLKKGILKNKGVLEIKIDVS